MSAEPHSTPPARERILLVLACAAIGWFYLWTARSSSDAWNFGAEQGDYYNLLIDGWLEGQLHMKVEVPEALAHAPNPYDPATRPPGGLHDASFYRGKYFLYFGAAPVVTLMLPFRVLTGVDLPLPAAILVFAFGGFLASMLIWLPVRRRYFPETHFGLVALGLLALAGGGMALVLVRRGNIWELPLSAGYFFSMTALLAVFWSLHAVKRNAAWLAVASLALGLAVASRPTYLFAAPLLLVPVAWRWRNFPAESRAAWCAAAVAPIACIGLALAAHNQARFGSPLEFGTRYMLGGANEAEARYFSAEYFGYNVSRYFLRPAQWLRYCPFIFPPAPGATPAGYYGTEEAYGALPGLLVLWCVPLAPLALWRRAAEERWRFGALLVAAWLLAAGPALVLCCFWAAMARYQVDFLPALLLIGGIGALAIERGVRAMRPRAAPAIRIGLGAAMIVSAFYGAMQSIALYGNLRRLNPATYARVACGLNTPAFWMETLARTQHGPLAIELTLTPRPPGTREPLVCTGVAGNHDRVMIVHESGGVRFACVHDGASESSTRVVPIDWTHSHRLRLAMGSLYPPEEHPFFRDRAARERNALTRWWRLELDGERLLERYQRFHPSSPGTLQTGGAIAPRAGEARFSGQIAGAERLAPEALLPRGEGHRFAAAPDDFTAVRLGAVFPSKPSGAREPLVSAGDIGRADFVFVEYLDSEHVRFGFDHWGKPTRFSEPMAMRGGERHTIEIALGSFGRATGVRRETTAPVRVRVDDRDVWSFSTKLFPIEPEDVFVGQNPIGGTSSATSFSGTISTVEWIAGERPRR